MITDEEQDRIEAMVEAFRLDHGIPEDLRPDMHDLLVRMRINGTILDFEAGSPGRGYSGEYDPVRNVISIADPILHRQSRKDRFTVAHEIGHKLDGRTTYIRHRKADSGKQFGKSISRDEEMANAIGIALLIPERLANVNEHTAPDELADRFSVSLPAAKLRLLTLQRRYRIRHGLRREFPIKMQGHVSSVDEIDSGDYDQAMSEMYKNWGKSHV